MMSREPDETMIHPKSSDGLIKRVPRTLIQGLRREWHSSALAFAGNKAHLRSISPAVSAHFPSPSRDFPRPFAFRIAYFSNRGNVESVVNTFEREILPIRSIVSSRLIALIFGGSRVIDLRVDRYLVR